MESSQDRIYKAILSETRRAMLRELKGRDLYPEDLAVIFELAPSTVSYHLRILEDAGFLSRHRQGKYILCRLKPTGKMLLNLDWSNRFLI